MISSRGSLIAWAVASLAFVLPQVSAQCNPLTSTCPPNPGLTNSEYSVDFTKQSAIPEGWTLANYATIKYGANGAEFTFNKRYDAPYMWTNFYILFGRVEVVMQAAPGVGVISSAVLMSDAQDEIDWEWSGNNFGSATGKVQTNYFGKGITGDYDRGTQPAVDSPTTKFHTYTFDWTPTVITWSIDGLLIRTLKAADCDKGAHQYPQSPSKLHLGVWDAGDPATNYGTTSWAGGYTDFTKAPFTAYVKSVKITNTNLCSQYEYGDKTGNWQSIKCTNTTLTSTSSSLSTSSSSISSSFSPSSSTLATTRPSYPNTPPAFDPLHPKPPPVNTTGQGTSSYTSKSSSSSSSTTTASSSKPSYPNTPPAFDPLHPNPPPVNSASRSSSFSSLSTEVSISTPSYPNTPPALDPFHPKILPLNINTISQGTNLNLSTSKSSSSGSPTIKPTTSTSSYPNTPPAFDPLHPIIPPVKINSASQGSSSSSGPTTKVLSSTTSYPNTPPAFDPLHPIIPPLKINTASQGSSSSTSATTRATSPISTQSSRPLSTSSPTTPLSNSASISPKPTPSTLKCNFDNCLRHLQNSRYAASATALCKTYTAPASTAASNGIIRATPAASATAAAAAIPSWLAGCQGKAERVTSACGCLDFGVAAADTVAAAAATGNVAGVRRAAVEKGGWGDDDDDDEEEEEEEWDESTDRGRGDEDGERSGRGKWNRKLHTRHANAHAHGWLHRTRAAAWLGR